MSKPDLNLSNLKVSVIIPAFNEFENLQKLKDFFILELEKDAFEIIIADSIHSKDQSLTLAYPYTYIKTKHHNRAKQMNFGAHHSNGDVLVFLHADVVPPRGFISEIKKVIPHQTEFGLFGYRFFPTSRMLEINAHFTMNDGIFTGGGDQIHIMTRTLFLHMNGYDESYEIMEDFDFFRRLKKSNKPYKILPNRATVSSRKYFKNSWFRVNLANLTAFLMFYFNADSKTIKNAYNKILN